MLALLVLYIMYIIIVKRILKLLWFLRFSNILNLKQKKVIFRGISLAIHNSKPMKDIEMPFGSLG